MPSSQFLPTWAPGAFALAVVLAARPTGLAAQGEPAGCAAWASAVEGAEATVSALDHLAECPVSGPPALSVAWARPVAPGTPEFNSLLSTSSTVRNATLYRTILGIAADAGRPTAVRLGVLGLLARYYDPKWEATPEWLTTARVGDEVPHNMHYRPAPRPDRSIVSEFPKLVTQLAWNDPDPVVRGAALRLRAWLAVSDPANTPVAPNSIVLVAGCGNDVTVESFADVTTPFTLRVLGTPYRDEIGLAGLKDTRIFKAPPNGQPRKILKSLPAGIVTASVGGFEITRLPDTERHKRCRTGSAPQ